MQCLRRRGQVRRTSILASSKSLLTEDTGHSIGDVYLPAASHSQKTPDYCAPVVSRNRQQRRSSGICGGLNDLGQFSITTGWKVGKTRNATIIRPPLTQGRRRLGTSKKRKVFTRKKERDSFWKLLRETPVDRALVSRNFAFRKFPSAPVKKRVPLGWLKTLRVAEPHDCGEVSSLPTPLWFAVRKKITFVYSRNCIERRIT